MAAAVFSRNTATNGSPSIRDPWPVSDIVYIAIVGAVMLAAFLEWILWLLAFVYCLIKVFQKATGEGKWSIRMLVIFNTILFVALRCIFLPIMIVTLPLPSRVVQYFPKAMVSTLQWFAFWAFAGLLTIPWLFCVYQLVTHNIGRSRRVEIVLDEHIAPKVVIILPCYNETPDILLRTVDSIVQCDYPPSCLHVFLSFDGDQEGELYLETIEKLGVPLTLRTYPKSIDVTYRDCRVTVSRFPHGGKRSCQKKSFKLIDKVYAEYLRRNDNLFLLFIDSDCILDRNCIQNFMYEMELKPGSKRNMLAMTGVITSTTEKHSLITVLQDMEYIHGQLFERSVESGCGAVTCLPGALTILRFSAFRRMAKYYFADKAEQCDDLFDYGKCHLGEDRWLTHLFMIGAKERYQIQMNTGAFCKTEAVQTFKSLLKQRRRWFLGFITNEVCMLTDIRLWKRYPLLLIIRLAQNTIRTTALLFFIMVISIISTSQKIQNLPVGFIAVSLGLNWALMLYFGAKLGRYKIMLYPLMFVVNPFLNWMYMVYGIFTAGQRTWGGPRADAGKADENTTPSQAVEIAEKTGDELNIVPETFKPALEANVYRQPLHVPLMPAARLEGRFAPAEELPGGWYRQQNDSGVLHKTVRRDAENGVSSGPRRDSLESVASSAYSVHTPRRVESIFSPEDARAYLQQQIDGPTEGGTYYGITVYTTDSLPGARDSAPQPVGNEDAVSIASRRSSASSVSMHYDFQHLPAIPPSTSNLPSHPQPNSIITQSTPRSRSPSPTSRALPVPGQSNAKAGKSPLARKSFTRLASPPLDSASSPPPLPPLNVEPRDLTTTSSPASAILRAVNDEGIPTPSAAEVISLERQILAANARSLPSSISNLNGGGTRSYDPLGSHPVTPRAQSSSPGGRRERRRLQRNSRGEGAFEARRGRAAAAAAATRSTHQDGGSSMAVSDDRRRDSSSSSSLSSALSGLLERGRGVLRRGSVFEQESDHRSGESSTRQRGESGSRHGTSDEGESSAEVRGTQRRQRRRLSKNPPLSLQNRRDGGSGSGRGKRRARSQ